MMRKTLVLLAAVAPLAAHAETITVTSADCGDTVAYTPDPSVEYKPGVAADGSAVAPADLPGSSMTVAPPKKITIDITRYYQDRFGLSSSEAQYGANLGKVTVENGKAYYNGQPLATGAQNAIAEACNKLRAKKGR